MIRTYDIDETCKRLNCKRADIEEAVLQELVDEFTPETDYIFDEVDEDTLEVEIISPHEPRE